MKSPQSPHSSSLWVFALSLRVLSELSPTAAISHLATKLSFYGFSVVGLRVISWHIELLGAPVFVYTNHCTLQNFVTQRDLSRRQESTSWAQFDLTIHYIVKGERNVIADALSRHSDDPCPSQLYLKTP